MPKIFISLMLIAAIPATLNAADLPPENRTDCVDLLINHDRFEPIKKGYEQISFYALGVTDETTAAIALPINQRLLQHMTVVLAKNGLSDEVLFVQTELSSRVNPLALELLAKGVPRSIVDDFHPNWELSEPSRRVIWDIRDPLYLALKCQVRKDVKWFKIWVKSDLKFKVLILLRQNTDGHFLNHQIRSGGGGHVT